jgi:hypoxanthine phosphoribosyltransferase
MNKSFVDYQTITSACDKLYNEIKWEKVDYLIGIGRGGLIPATILAYKLNLPVYNLGLTSYRGSTRGSIIEYQSIDLTILNKEKNILIVDDLADSGSSLHYAVDKFKGLVGKVLTATLYLKGNSTFTPDFYAYEADPETWIEFPYEVTSQPTS